MTPDEMIELPSIRYIRNSAPPAYSEAQVAAFLLAEILRQMQTPHRLTKQQLNDYNAFLDFYEKQLIRKGTS